MSNKIKEKCMKYRNEIIVCRFIFILTIFGLTQLFAFMVIITYFKTSGVIFQVGLIGIINFIFYRVSRILRLL